MPGHIAIIAMVVIIIRMGFSCFEIRLADLEKIFSSFSEHSVLATVDQIRCHLQSVGRIIESAKADAKADSVSRPMRRCLRGNVWHRRGSPESV